MFDASVLRNTVYNQDATADAINRTLEGVPDDVREDVAAVISTLINETIVLTSSDPNIPTAAIWDPASSVWLNGTDAFIKRNKASIDNNLRICEHDLHGSAPEEGLPLMQLVHTVALQAMLCLAVIRYEQ